MRFSALKIKRDIHWAGFDAIVLMVCGRKRNHNFHSKLKLSSRWQLKSAESCSSRNFIQIDSDLMMSIPTRNNQDKILHFLVACRFVYSMFIANWLRAWINGKKYFGRRSKSGKDNKARVFLHSFRERKIYVLTN